MAVSTEGLTRSRTLITPAQLGALLVALAVAVTLAYSQREEPTITSKPLSASAIENSRAFVREEGAVEPAQIYGSGAYIRELPHAALGLSAAAITNSRAFVREQGAPLAEIFGSGAYIRELMATSVVSIDPELVWQSGAHVREQPPAASPPMTFPGTWAHVREAPN